MRIKFFLLFFFAMSFLGGGCASLEKMNIGTQNSNGNITQPKPYVEIQRPSGFVNTEPFMLADVVGKKVILVDILTYSCINCIRTFPYLNEWYEKYKDDGLEIVGIHTPEFAFEKKKENVEAAMKKYGIKFPIVMDNDYATWNAYDNRYWPHKYLIDINGNIVYDHIGEGGYAETEEIIQRLLMERMAKFKMAGTIADKVSEENKIAFEPSQIGSPEIYFGSARNELLGNGRPFRSGLQMLRRPSNIELNSLYLVGNWQIEPEYALNQSADASILFRYSSKQVNIVASAAKTMTATILLDGKPIGNAAGEDVKDGALTIEADTIYEVVNDPEGYGEHTLEIIIDEPGLQVFTFTFG